MEDKSNKAPENSALNQFVIDQSADIEKYFNDYVAKKYGHKPQLLDMMSDVATENIENEKLFIAKVISAYEGWSKEQDVVVMWDIDDTMGKYEGDEFVLRPSLLALFTHLRESFPNVKNGILSNRVDMGFDKEPLSEIEQFIEPDSRYTSRNVVFSNEKADEVEHLVSGFISRPTTNDLVQKYLFISEKKGAGENIKLIDDGEVAKCLDKDSVYVGDCMINY